MDFDSDLNMDNLKMMKEDFKELKSEIQSGISADPEYAGEADVIIHSIDNLLEELDQIKSSEDIDLKKKVKIDALLFWVSKLLPDLMGEEEFENEDDDSYEFFDDEGEMENGSFFFDELEVTQISDLQNSDQNKKQSKTKSSPPKKEKKKK